MLFLRVIVWCGAEKFSLKKSCFYLYIRREHECDWSSPGTLEPGSLDSRERQMHIVMNHIITLIMKIR